MCSSDLIDALVFTAGIGENRPAFRNAICAGMDQLGIILDPGKNNATKAQEGIISSPESRVKVLIIPTNEELVVAREVKRFLENNPRTSIPNSDHATRNMQHAAARSS